ncbi:DUF1217 domain-containing protein [Yoonia sp. BS5-3]|uniref:DUF1217 domain-containing protein n=1 Tax=Yoonia phaeophyticola TaxID=3137369 RepID=A0ABZ2V5E0_9RHOB
MSFQPVVPLTGYVGWRFLERTIEAQQTAFAESAPVERATSYFRENIGNVVTAEELVSDRQLLSVALGAFGLDDDIDNSFFIKTILEEGTLDDDALANRLADTRYSDFSRAFGFGDLGIPRTILSTFADEIVDRFEDRQFEAAVGEQDNDLRLAMNVDTAVGDVLANASTTEGQWFAIMGNAPLRSVIQTALGLPDSIASIDIDKQREIFQERATSVLGTDDVSELIDPDMQEKLIRLFLVRSEAAAINISSGSSTALTLLQSAV